MRRQRLRACTPRARCRSHPTGRQPDWGRAAAAAESAYLSGLTMAVEQGSSAPDFTLPDTHGTPGYLADFGPHGETARAFGVLDEDHGRALRGSFLIDADGLVRWLSLIHISEPTRL